MFYNLFIASALKFGNLNSRRILLVYIKLMLSWCLWLVAPFFSKGISDPEICITKQVPPFLHTLFSYNLGCPLLQYPSEQETRTSEFSKRGTNLMCNCTEVLVNCFLVFFVLIFMFIEQSEISK